MDLNKQKYYTGSYKSNWGILKQKMKKQCFLCKKENNLVLHHLTYDNFSNEKEEELMTLCRSCHAKIHRVPTLFMELQVKDKQNQEFNEESKREQSEVGCSLS